MAIEPNRLTPQQQALYRRLPDLIADGRITGRFARLIAEMKARQEEIVRNE